MEIDDLRNVLNQVDTTNPDSVEMKMIEKIGVEGMIRHQPMLIPKMREELKTFYLRILTNDFFEMEQSEYNPNVVVEGTLQVSDLETAHIDEMLVEIDNLEDVNHDMENVELDKINYYCFKFSVDEDVVYIFRRFNKMKKIRNGILGRFQDNSFRRIETEGFFGIDRDIDIIVFREEALIINRFALQTIFQLNDYFNEQARVALDILNQHNVFQNFNVFNEDCLNDKLAARRMTKILNTEGRLDGFVQNINQLAAVIEQFDLEIEISADNQIIYNGSKESRSQILFCISDAYYQSLILQRLGEDIS